MQYSETFITKIGVDDIIINSEEWVRAYIQNDIEIHWKVLQRIYQDSRNNIFSVEYTPTIVNILSEYKDEYIEVGSEKRWMSNTEIVINDKVFDIEGYDFEIDNDIDGNHFKIDAVKIDTENKQIYVTFTGVSND